MDLVINARMLRVDKEGNQESVKQMFYGGAKNYFKGKSI